MTRPAEALTIECVDQPGIFAPHKLRLSINERRPVLPAHFADWYSARWRETEAGWFAQTFGFSRFPFLISTAIRGGIVVRLELKENQLRRKWVAFSANEKPLLEKWKLEGAHLSSSTEENCVKLVFSLHEQQIELLEQFELLNCSGNFPHWYRERSCNSGI